MQSSGNTPLVLNGSTEGEVVEPVVVQDEDAQASLAQAVDTADEKAQLSTEQTTEMEVSKPSLDVQDENSSFGKQLMKLISFW
jgi:tRNA (adenine-N(1)-)-methyltransferase non-catalytic subunit